jgi:hypothetical protein
VTGTEEKFTDVAGDGCPRCGGRQFRLKRRLGRGFLRGGLIGAAVAASKPQAVECVTCGAVYRRG